jgi:hypothetical protein
MAYQKKHFTNTPWGIKSKEGVESWDLRQKHAEVTVASGISELCRLALKELIRAFGIAKEGEKVPGGARATWAFYLHSSRCPATGREMTVRRKRWKGTDLEAVPQKVSGTFPGNTLVNPRQGLYVKIVPEGLMFGRQSLSGTRPFKIVPFRDWPQGLARDKPKRSVPEGLASGTGQGLLIGNRFQGLSRDQGLRGGHPLSVRCSKVQFDWHTKRIWSEDDCLYSSPN